MYNTTNSLNKINQIFKDFAERNQMLNDYAFGQISDIGSRVMKFPYMWTLLIGSAYTDNGLAETYHFQIYFFDRIMFGEENSADVISDMQYVYRQFYGEIFRHPYWDDLELVVVDSRTTAQVMYLATDANVSGWMLDLYIKEPVRVTYDNSPLLPAPTQPANPVIYPYFWGISSTLPTTISIDNTIYLNEANEVMGDSTGAMYITFNAATQYMWFAVPGISPIKTNWFISDINAGSIGGAENLFGSASNVNVSSSSFSDVPYNIYISNYETTTTGVMTIG